MLFGKAPEPLTGGLVDDAIDAAPEDAPRRANLVHSLADLRHRYERIVKLLAILRRRLVIRVVEGDRVIWLRWVVGVIIVDFATGVIIADPHGAHRLLLVVIGVCVAVVVVVDALDLPPPSMERCRRATPVGKRFRRAIAILSRASISPARAKMALCSPSPSGLDVFSAMCPSW